MAAEFNKIYDSNQISIVEMNKSIKKISYEEALNQTSIGRFNYLILFVCSLGLLSNGIQNGISAYLLPSLQCEFDISTSEMAMANISFMTGGILSAYIWGIFSNIIGIKTVITFTLYADFISMLIGSLSQNYLLFLITRLLCGFFTGGPGYLLFTYLVDFIPKKMRSTYICYAGFCFIMSWILLPGIALFIIPLEIESYFDSFTFTSWRLYSLIFTIPSLAAALMMSKLPESPKQLLIKGKEKQCLKILKRIFVINTGKSEYNYEINSTQEIISSTEEMKNNERFKTNKYHTLCIFHANVFLKETLLLFNKNNIFKTINTIFVMFTNMFGCYGLGLWIPELLLDINIDTDTYIKINETLNRRMINDQNICEDAVDSHIYIDTIVIGIACLCYNFITSCLAQHINARYLTSFSMILGGFASFLFITLDASLLRLAAIGIFQSAMATGNVIAISVILEAFPAKLSSMAVCLATLSGRIGAICSNISFGILMEISSYYPILIVSTLAIVGAILIIFIKKNECHTIEPIPHMKNIGSNCNIDSITTHI